MNGLSTPRLARIDWRILSVLMVLSGLSVLFVYSAGYDPSRGIYIAFWKKQLMWILISAGILALMLRVPYRVMLDHAWLVFGAGILALVFVMFAGTVINGARRWVNLGFTLLQPSEFMKVVLILALARLIRWQDDYKKLRGLVKPFAVTLFPMALILKQPDLGTAILFLPILFVMLWLAGARAKHLALVMLMGIICLPIIYLGFLKDYQRNRVDAFLFQSSARGEKMSQDEAYHMIRSKIAVGSGGVTGKGLMEGAQQVPYNETDFIFTVVAEEWGFLGSMLVLGLYLVLLLLVADVAVTTTEPSGKLLAGGVFTLLFVQIAVNVGMTVGLAPITGLTLPFLSYGGSSLLSLTLAIGLVLNVKLYPDFVFKRDL
ncbi:MAG: rod shape-determining protein RodA [Planctomycetota bacterium]